MIRLEYPVGLVDDGRLLTGYVDLVAFADDRETVVDFKTDHPPRVSLARAILSTSPR